MSGQEGGSRQRHLKVPGEESCLDDFVDSLKTHGSQLSASRFFLDFVLPLKRNYWKEIWETT